MGWQEFFQRYSLAMTAASVITFVGGVAVMRYVIIHMPADYFLRDGQEKKSFLQLHPAVRWILLILKNALGAIFLMLGFVMLAIPGPGVMFLLLGLSLVNLPGKRRLELWLVRFPKVHSKIDAIRIKHGHPPLKLPPMIM